MVVAPFAGRNLTLRLFHTQPGWFPIVASPCGNNSCSGTQHSSRGNSRMVAKRWERVLDYLFFVCLCNSVRFF